MRWWSCTAAAYADGVVVVASHRAQTDHSARGRTALLALAGLVVGLVAGLGGQGTLAFWTDSDTVRSGTFTTGTLDLTVDAHTGTTTYTKTELAGARLVPGESIAAVVEVGNGGDAPFTWSASAVASDQRGTGLTYELVPGGTVQGQRAAYPRNQTCGPPAAGYVRRVEVGSVRQTLCVVVRLPQTADNTVQGKDGYALTVTLAATQALS